jgi:hypothetical protein
VWKLVKTFPVVTVYALIHQYSKGYAWKIIFFKVLPLSFYRGEVGKGKRVDVYLEVRKRRGHIFFE